MDLRRDHLDPPLNGPAVEPSGGGRTESIARAVVGAVVAVLVVENAISAIGNRAAANELWAAGAVVVLGAALGWQLPIVADRLLPRPGDAALVLGVVLAVTYLCVPETDQFPPVAVAVGALVMTEAVVRHRAPLPVLAALAAWVLWAGVYGATLRESALVGALAAWWPVLVLPVLAAWRPGLAAASLWVRGGIVAVAAVAAAAVARTGALAETVWPALAAAAVALPASAALAALIAARATRRATTPSAPPAAGAAQTAATPPVSVSDDDRPGRMG